MRKFYKVINYETGSWELVLADKGLDALSFYRKKNNVERSVILACHDLFVYNNDGEQFTVTRLSELPNNVNFHKVFPVLGVVCDESMRKISRVANGVVKCRHLDDPGKPFSFLKGSTYVTVEVQDGTQV